MKLGVLQVGPMNPALAEHGGYSEMFEALLAPLDPSIVFTSYPVIDDVIPGAVDEQDGWLIGGSKYGVYEDLPWIEPLKDFIRRASAAGVPVVGICFGHQIIAEALGGRVEKSGKGWGLGALSYHLTERGPWMTEAPADLRIHAMHQDQVVEKPEGARVLMQSEFCEYAGLAYGDTVFSMQPHPEFSPEFSHDLIKLRRGQGVPEPVADAALETLGAPVDSKIAGQWIVDFLRRAAATRQSPRS